jgi:hypothetical protein
MTEKVYLFEIKIKFNQDELSLKTHPFPLARKGSIYIYRKFKRRLIFQSKPVG